MTSPGDRVVRVRRHNRAVAVGSFLAGVLMTAVGVGVGLTHLAKSGLGPVGVLGALALCLGAVLLVLGGSALVRSTSRWWRLVLVPVLILTAVLGTYLLAVPLRAAAPASGTMSTRTASRC